METQQGRRRTDSHGKVAGNDRRLMAIALRATPYAQFPSQPESRNRNNLQNNSDLTELRSTILAEELLLRSGIDRPVQLSCEFHLAQNGASCVHNRHAALGPLFQGRIDSLSHLQNIIWACNQFVENGIYEKAQ